MKSAALLFAAVFGAWSWLRPAAPRTGHAWPPGMPAFAGACRPGFSAVLANGTRFVSALASEPPEQVLANVRRTYAEAGWAESPVRARDMLVFTRGEAVAAVLAQTVPEGTRVTAIQRPRGL